MTNYMEITLSGLIGAIIASLLTTFFSFKLLKEDFKLKNKKEYLERIISEVSLECYDLNKNLEIIKGTKKGKRFLEKSDPEKEWENIEKKLVESIIKGDIGSLYLTNNELLLAVIKFLKLANDIRKAILKWNKSEIKTIEERLNRLNYQKFQIIDIARKELKI